ncbi:metallophosphoesterase, partial [Bacillaceae bacterium SIJ1]|uniref:metallophosphoesterase n=1 Tax=Litoribacterium kuwaitense TaxID=1398745 RepID=UPI001BAC77B3
NRDDFLVRDIRLILEDGTVIRDPDYSDPLENIAVGDSSSALQSVDLSFNIPKEKLVAKAYLWDTTAFTDGAHTLTVSYEGQEKEHTVYVDNTAPFITSSLRSTPYKGSFTIDAEVIDDGAGVKTTTVMLDEELIDLPYETSSARLSPGEHTLTIEATDDVGNQRQETFTFTTVDEHPNQPDMIMPADGATDVSLGTPLQAKVTDPTNDALQVRFFEGRKHFTDSGTITFSKGATDTEPPIVLHPDAEEMMNDAEKQLMAAIDNEMVTTTTSNGTFPYHRFDINLKQPLKQHETAEAVWHGKTLPGRKVTMYAWNPSADRWVSLVEHIGEDEESFELKATIDRSFIENKKIQLLVQDEIPSSPDDYDYTFVWMTDTQYYAQSYPHIFKSQVEWIRDQQEEMDIKYVFHTGDIVNVYNNLRQWEVADKHMSILEDANIPYGVLAGNHDVEQQTIDYNMYEQYFGEYRFAEQHYYGESYKNNRGHYDLISAEGNDFIMLYMGWGVNEEGIAWMNDVLARYPNRMAILNFHEYLLTSANRSDVGVRVYENVVKPNPNVIAVLSGHYFDSETLIDPIDDDGDGEPDRHVYQMLADYQGGPEGGQGYMRLFHVDKDSHQIYVNTYSPYMDDYNFFDTDEYGEKDEFIIPLSLEPLEKQIATDAFALNIYTDKPIGQTQSIESGETATVEWATKKDKMYSWYIIATDTFGGTTRSDLYTFTTHSSTRKAKESFFR